MEPNRDLTAAVKQVALAAGLGELGLSKLFLTPQFGPRQRIFAVLTDAVLEPDPLLPPGSVCDRCGACARACMDHLEKSGRIEKQYQTPMIEGKQWVLE